MVQRGEGLRLHHARGRRQGRKRRQDQFGPLRRRARAGVGGPQISPGLLPGHLELDARELATLRGGSAWPGPLRQAQRWTAFACLLRALRVRWRWCPTRASPRPGAGQVIETAVALKRENPARTATQVRRILRAQMGWSPGERTLQRRFAADPQIAALLGLWSTIMLKGESAPSGIPLLRDSLCARRPRGAGRAALCL